MIPIGGIYRYTPLIHGLVNTIWVTHTKVKLNMMEFESRRCT